VAGQTLVARRAGPSSVSTGLPELDRLVGLAARTGRLEIHLRVEPRDPERAGDVAGAELGRALRPLLEATGARGFGAGILPTDEALASVVVEASGRPLVAANVDLAQSHLGGLETDVFRRFLGGLADAAGLTIHVRLVEGEDTAHVLDAIFKALGVALGDACTVVDD
jgi:imidazoleglycerol-phosphate dehydratase